MINLERVDLHHLEFREGPRWAYTDPGTHNRLVSPAFAEREDAEAWLTNLIEADVAGRVAEQDAAQAVD